MHAVPGVPACAEALRQALALARSGPVRGAAPGLAPSCRLLEVRLPAGARYTGYRFEAEDETGGGDCLAGRECPVGQCQWTGDPALHRGAEGTTLTAGFENHSSSRTRRAVLTVYYTVGTAAQQ